MDDSDLLKLGDDAPWLKIEPGQTLLIEWLSATPIAEYDRAVRNGEPKPHTDWHVLVRKEDGEEPSLYRLTVYGRLREALIGARARVGKSYRISRVGGGTETRYRVTRV